MSSARDVLDALADRGYRETDSRRLIAQAVASQISTFSARDIYGQLARLGVGRATVFRTLSLLQELGLLNRLHVGDGCDRYALCEPRHHHHLVCVGCGAVFPLGRCTISEDAKHVAGDLRFHIEGHHMDVFGRCAACAGG